MRAVHAGSQTGRRYPGRPLVVGKQFKRVRVASAQIGNSMNNDWTHLRELESESIYILRETVAQFRNPVLLYSIGKDSSVLVHLARKAFYPGPLPFPFLHVDTGYKFKEMIEFRDRFCKEIGARLIVHRNEDAIAAGAHPLKLGVARKNGSFRCATRSANGIRGGSVPSCGRCTAGRFPREKRCACSLSRTGP